MYHYYIKTFEHVKYYLFNFLLRKNRISDAGAKEIAQNFIHLKGLT